MPLLRLCEPTVLPFYRSTVLLLMLFITFQSCEKDKITITDSSLSTDERIDQRSLEASESHVYNVTDETAGNQEYTQTVLGEEIVNPFSVSNLVQAHANLYPEDETISYETTDLYIKFLPASIEEVKELYSSGLVVFDYPLHYELIKEGDYYHDIVIDDPHPFYAIIGVGTELPSIAYEIVDEYHFGKPNPVILAESFRITGNEEDMEEHTGILPRYLEEGLRVMEIPECEEPCEVKAFLDDSVHPPVIAWFCDCPPSPPVPAPLNECGCPVFQSVRKPAGCIKVQDTQYSTPGDPSTFLPVRRVKVFGKNKFNSSFTTFANDNGCWNYNKEFYGSIDFQIIFEHERAKIRGARSNTKNPFNLLKPVKDFLGTVWGPVFNDIEVNYHLWGEQGSWGHMYWGAAHVNNSLHEMHDFAVLDGIAPPPLDLDLYVGWQQTFGYAVMKNFIGTVPFFNAVANGFLNGNGSFISPYLITNTSTFTILGIVDLFMPDVFVGIDFSFSDRLKALSYHEFAHTSHYTVAGSVFWQNLIYGEVVAEFADGDPHGVATSLNAGHISVAESWAGFIGWFYANRTYPPGIESIVRDWGQRLERIHNEVAMHIPVGLHNDLIDASPDVGNEPLISCLDDGSSCFFVTDNVDEFTISELFSLLDAGTISMPIFRTRLETNFLPSTTNTQSQMDALFFDYGL